MHRASERRERGSEPAALHRRPDSTPLSALWVGLGCPGGTRQAGEAASSRLWSKACIRHCPDTLSPLGSMLVKGSFKVTFYTPAAPHRTVTHRTGPQGGGKVTAVLAGHTHTPAHKAALGIGPGSAASAGSRPWSAETLGCPGHTLLY